MPAAAEHDEEVGWRIGRAFRGRGWPEDVEESKLGARLVRVLEELYVERDLLWPQ